MASEKTIFVLDNEAEDFSKLAEKDIVAFVATSEGGSVFKYLKSETQKYNNGYLAVIVKGDEIVPFELSHSSITAPYGCEKPFTKDLNKDFDNLPKVTHKSMLGKTAIVKAVKEVPFKKKNGDTIQWKCYHLVATDSEFTPTADQQALINEYATERLTKKNNG